MALSTARIHRVRGRPPLLAAGITSLIHSHSSSVRSLGYIFSFIYPFYTTREDFSDRLLQVLTAAADAHPATLTLDLRTLQFLNSSGINTLAKFVLHARQSTATQVVLKGSHQFP